MGTVKNCMLIVLLIAFPEIAVAETTAEAEIQHLLMFVETSTCSFIRNSTRHAPEEAGNHLQIKYNYLKGRIRTAEQFIRYTATKSSMSGKLYMVDCDGLMKPSSDWLFEELQRLRDSR